MATDTVLTPVLTPLLEVKQMIADLILNGWTPWRARRIGTEVFWLANEDRRSFKGACYRNTMLRAGDHTLMQDIVIDLMQSSLAHSECDWKWVPEDLIPKLHATREFKVNI